MLAGLFSYPKGHFNLCELLYLLTLITYFLHITKIRAKENCRFSTHFNPKIIGDNRCSEKIFTETVCWVRAPNEKKIGERLHDGRLLGLFLPEVSKSHFLAHRGVVYILNEARHQNSLIGENFSLNFYHCEGLFDFS